MGALSASSRGDDSSAPGSHRRFERLPDLALDLRGRWPAVVGARCRDAALVDEHEGDLLEHRERLVPGLVIPPLEDAGPRADGALVNAVDHDVARLRPALLRHVDAVHEEDAEELRLGEIVAGERVRRAYR